MNATNPKNLTPKQVIKVLVDHGFYKKRVRGDDAFYYNDKTKRATTVTLRRKTFSSSEILTISSQSNIPREYFRKA